MSFTIPYKGTTYAQLFFFITVNENINKITILSHGRYFVPASIYQSVSRERDPTLSPDGRSRADSSPRKIAIYSRAIARDQ